MRRRTGSIELLTSGYGCLSRVISLWPFFHTGLVKWATILLQSCMWVLHSKMAHMVALEFGSIVTKSDDRKAVCIPVSRWKILVSSSLAVQPFFWTGFIQPLWPSWICLCSAHPKSRNCLLSTTIHFIMSEIGRPGIIQMRPLRLFAWNRHPMIWNRIIPLGTTLPGNGHTFSYTMDHLPFGLMSYSCSWVSDIWRGESVRAIRWATYRTTTPISSLLLTLQTTKHFAWLLCPRSFASVAPKILKTLRLPLGIALSLCKNLGVYSLQFSCALRL